MGTGKKGNGKKGNGKKETEKMFKQRGKLLGLFISGSRH